MAKGDVTYELRADDSKIESDIERANRKVEKALSKAKGENVEIDVDADTTEAKEKLEELADVAEDLEEQLEEPLGGDEEAIGFWQNLGGVIKGSLSEAVESSVPFIGKIGELTAGLSAAQVAAIGMGAAVAGISVLAVGAANDMSVAMNGFLAETGKSADETERYQEVLENIYANNYGESFEDIASAMASITKNLGEMDDAALQELTESAFALRDTFEYDITESTRAAKAMMDNFGVSGQDAMSMIAAGAQNGLDYSGELLDSISEYSVQFAKVGLDADDMFKIFQKGAESGAFNLDKVGDAIKELSIRAIDGSDATKKAFDDLGFVDLTEEFAAGGDRAKEAFETILWELNGMQDKVKQNEIGVALFGTMWEDLGEEAVTALVEIQDGAYDAAGAMNQIMDVKYDDLGSMFEALKRNVELLLIPIGEALIPLLGILIETLLPVLTGLLGPLCDLFGTLLVPIVALISGAIQPLIDILNFLISNVIQPLINIIGTSLVSVFTGSLEGMFNTGSEIIGNIINIFQNLIDFIKNVFTGNWSGAWSNIKNILNSTVSTWASIVKAPLNAIVSAWNKLAGSLAKITVPEWVPGVGGKSIKLPTLPRLKVGMDYVPSDMYPAFLDKGEWVLTKEEADALRSLGGIENVISFMKNPESSKEIFIEGNSNFDYGAMGEAVYEAFKRYGLGISIDRREFGRIVEEVANERGY